MKPNKTKQKEKLNNEKFKNRKCMSRGAAGIFLAANEEWAGVRFSQCKLKKKLLMVST